jgi:hypothetical protein
MAAIRRGNAKFLIMQFVINIMKPLSIIDEIGLAPYTDDPARIAILADWCEDVGHWAAWYYRARRDMVQSGDIVAWVVDTHGQCRPRLADMSQLVGYSEQFSTKSDFGVDRRSD